MTISKKLLFVVPLVAILMALTAPSASADITQLNLTSDHCTGGCGPAGTVFGIVLLIPNGANVDVIVPLIFPPYAFAKTGAADFQAFKFNATGVVLADITVDAHTPTLTADAGSFNGGGTGAFGFGIICSSCGNGLSDAFINPIMFHVANATIADLTAPNNLGNVFVADVGNTVTGNTGPIDASGPGTSVPEPSSVLTLGLAVLGLGLATRRLKV